MIVLNGDEMKHPLKEGHVKAEFSSCFVFSPFLFLVSFFFFSYSIRELTRFQISIQQGSTSFLETLINMEILHLLCLDIINGAVCIAQVIDE